MMAQGDLAKLNDPNFVLELAIGPPQPTLVPQQPGSGIVLGGQYSNTTRRFLFKKAHMSADDYRIFDHSNGRLVCVSHHVGKNPYAGLDPLGLGHAGDSPYTGEWESICYVSGYHGMPSFRTRPKAMSMHGRQLVQDPGGSQTFFNVARLSRLHSMSIRHNLEVCRGVSEDPTTYSVLIDLANRTFQIVNERNEQVAFLQKSMKTLMMNVAMGVGSEIVIDVAPGVDCSAILGIVIGMQQIGKHFLKDAASNFVVSPLQDYAVDQVTTAAGLDGVAADLGHATDAGITNLRYWTGFYNSYFR